MWIGPIWIRSQSNTSLLHLISCAFHECCCSELVQRRNCFLYQYPAGMRLLHGTSSPAHMQSTCVTVSSYVEHVALQSALRMSTALLFRTFDRPSHTRAHTHTENMRTTMQMKAICNCLMHDKWCVKSDGHDLCMCSAFLFVFTGGCLVGRSCPIYHQVAAAISYLAQLILRPMIKRCIFNSSKWATRAESFIFFPPSLVPYAFKWTFFLTKNRISVAMMFTPLNALDFWFFFRLVLFSSSPRDCGRHVHHTGMSAWWQIKTEVFN